MLLGLSASLVSRLRVRFTTLDWARSPHILSLRLCLLRLRLEPMRRSTDGLA